MLPEGELEEEWIAFNIFEICEFTKLLVNVILPICKCPTMSAGCNFEYLWVSNDGQ